MSHFLTQLLKAISSVFHTLLSFPSKCPQALSMVLEIDQSNVTKFFKLALLQATEEISAYPRSRVLEKIIVQILEIFIMALKQQKELFGFSTYEFTLIAAVVPRAPNLGFYSHLI